MAKIQFGSGLCYRRTSIHVKLWQRHEYRLSIDAEVDLDLACIVRQCVRWDW
jgi:hypothetical protein